MLLMLGFVQQKEKKTGQECAVKTDVVIKACLREMCVQKGGYITGTRERKKVIK